MRPGCRALGWPRDAGDSLQNLPVFSGSSGETGFRRTLAQGRNSPCESWEGRVRQEMPSRGSGRGGLSPGCSMRAEQALARLSRGHPCDGRELDKLSRSLPALAPWAASGESLGSRHPENRARTEVTQLCLSSPGRSRPAGAGAVLRRQNAAVRPLARPLVPPSTHRPVPTEPPGPALHSESKACVPSGQPARPPVTAGEDGSAEKRKLSVDGAPFLVPT